MDIRFISLVFTMFGGIHVSSQHVLTAPGGHIRLEVTTTRALSYKLSFDGKPMLLPSVLDLAIAGGPSLSDNYSTKNITIRKVADSILSPVPEKRSVIRDEYNEMRIQFRQPFALVFRLYDDAFAYRFETTFKDSIKVQNEVAGFNFPAGSVLYFPEVEKRADADSFHTSFESVYQHCPVDCVPAATLFFNPALVVPPEGPKMVLTESAIEDYPGMFQRGTLTDRIDAVFAPYPLKEKLNGTEFPQWVVTQRAGYIAHTKGTRAYPWRVLAIAPTDASLPVNDIVYRLAPPSRVADASWVHPGKGTDEWIIGINLFNIPFRAGLNTATYKFYIDFAKRFGFERIMMDAGWSDNTDLFRITPAIDMDELAAYAKAQGVRLSMWTLASTLDRQLDSALSQFKKWGVDYIMTDFMDRDDQKMVNFYYRVAEACAREKIMVMFHGAFKPAGFNRTYPNSMTREAVLGSEYNIWSDKADPGHDLLLPFIRMVGGSFDYEPGILDNATRAQFRPIGEKVMSMGTRCHQLAMFLVYDNPMQIFSGNPSQGLLEPAFMELLGSLPTTWDETKILDAKLGEYIITARRKGKDWYVGAMTNWTQRTLTLETGFLGEGRYAFEMCSDGVNAARYPSDYRITKGSTSKGAPMEIEMAPGGGYLMRLIKQ